MSESYDQDPGTPPGDGGTPTNWIESLPEGLRDAPFISKAETPEAALDAIKNAASYMGQSIRIPSEDASDEDRKAFYDKLTEKAPDLMVRPNQENMDQFYESLGRPKDPKDYNFEPGEGKELPADFEGFAKVAYKYGLTQDQFRGVIGDVLESQSEASEIAEAEQKQEMKALGEEWGMAFDRNMSAVKNFLKLTEAPEGIVDMIAEGAMSPSEIKWLHGIATQTKSPVELADIKSTQDAELTPSEARNRIQEMMNNSEHPYWNASDPRHKDAMDTMIKYQRAAAGG